jgi:hypothetical protein
MGYTTKPESHGFGLHASCNAAAEIGGSLRLLDPLADEPGAVFELTLPDDVWPIALIVAGLVAGNDHAGGRIGGVPRVTARSERLGRRARQKTRLRRDGVGVDPDVAELGAGPLGRQVSRNEKRDGSPCARSSSFRRQ